MKLSFLSALEQNLNVFQSERESFVKSRDWYRDQMHAVQEARSVIQQELINIQSESASKSNHIEKLKIELLGNSKMLEDERERALQEKEEMKRQLEELEVCIYYLILVCIQTIGKFHSVVGAIL